MCHSELSHLQVDNPGFVLRPQVGQAVLLPDGHSWRRASVLQTKHSTVSVLLVDGGGEMEVQKTELYQIPCEVAAFTALTTVCGSVHISRLEGGHWSSQALLDWTQLVKDKRLKVLRVVDTTRNIVELSLGEMGPLVEDCLQFLGHIPVIQPSKTEFQREEKQGHVGLACIEQEQPTPDCLLLLFRDNPQLEERLETLQRIQEEAGQLESPPGWVEVGSALLAPWQVTLLLSFQTIHSNIHNWPHQRFV